jgi:hypothetical protein
MRARIFRDPDGKNDRRPNWPWLGVVICAHAFRLKMMSFQVATLAIQFSN